ncbi:MAG: response regulator [Pseudodesulfovibrio sp.]|uniref:response regulator n=1 Tax=Pseudodesulfovibrio sp. TaxID=2035812 RepID=UPI003D0F65C2
MVADQQRVQQIVHSVMEFLLAGTLWGGIQANVDYLQKNGVLVLAFSSSATGERIDKECFYPRPNLDASGKSWTLTTIGPIVDGLGGSLDVKATPSNGVDIILQIPARPTGDEIPAIDDARTVLVVEDDEFSRLYTERALDKLGFEVESVRLGEEAVSKAGERQYGLILLDIQLPDSDGVTVARRIRTPEGPNAATRIIAVTAHATPEDRHRYEKAGIDQFIAKPFKIETLAEAMGKGPSTGKAGR